MRQTAGTYRIIRTLLLLLAVAMGGVGCSHDSGDEAGRAPVTPSLYLNIYIEGQQLSNKQSAPRRAYIGDVAATEAENKVSSVQIWVFTHNDGTLVGYLNPAIGQLNSQRSATYLMLVPDEFAQNPTSVDVYVLANVAHTHQLDETTTRQELEDALMLTGDQPFGLTVLTTVVPDEGLPMSGVLRDQPVYGDSPVLRIGTAQQPAIVNVTRMVSKVRFLFGCAVTLSDFQMTRVELAGNMIPADEYLFLSDDGNDYHLGNSYVDDATTLATITEEVPKIEDPETYEYLPGMAPSYYDRLVNAAVADGHLLQAGPFYLRESDKRLSGTIHYMVDGVLKEAPFQMERAGDFSRNHTWIVYSYYAGNATDRLVVNDVFVTDWNEVNQNHEVYNW
ncbi:fimbrial protein [Xylanibacter brevis]|uniref:fimbrial protein n=1 Tax=Xylanibacter brevis TaxID=83231 RepID=UPI000AC4A9AF|nr:fimbrial protein [Xylanibacter brevis]